VIAIDTNILVYARRDEVPEHAAAVKLIERLATSPEPWAIPWPCVHEYLRVVTNFGLYKRPAPVDRILTDLDRLLDSPSLVVLAEGPMHRRIFLRAVADGAATGNLVFDARIAAILLEHGVDEFWTNDRDFRRFPGIAVRNPFVASDEVHETRVRYRARPAHLAGVSSGTGRKGR
jgi:toxin-antitoxin system PIN domain toxin